MKHRPIPKKHVNHDILYPRLVEPSIINAAYIYLLTHGLPPPQGWTVADAVKLMAEYKEMNHAR